jgi:hypothetical protein
MRLVRSEREDPEIMLGGVPSVALPHCWLQVAAESSVDELVAVADALTRRQRPKSEKDLLALAVAEREGTRGIRKARLALDLCVEGTDSIPETFLRLAVIRGGLPCPAVNHRVSNSWGDVEYYLDLAYPDKMVAIEYDGAYHVGDRNQMAKDATRRRFLEDHGWRVITATAIDLKSPNSLLTSIRRARS